MTTRRRRRHAPEQIVRKLRDADALLNAGKDEAAVLQSLEVSQATYDRWRKPYGGMKAEEAKRLKELKIENRHLKALVAEKELDIRMLRHISEGNGSALLESEQPGNSFKVSSGSPSVVRARWWTSHVARNVTRRSLGAMRPDWRNGCCRWRRNGLGLAIAESGLFFGFIRRSCGLETFDGWS